MVQFLKGWQRAGHQRQLGPKRIPDGYETEMDRTPCRESLVIVCSVKGKRERDTERERLRERGGGGVGRGEEASTTSSEERQSRKNAGWKRKKDLLALVEGEKWERAL